MGLREVSNILWRERHLLEMLLFKLEEEQLLLAAGRSRWLSAATREVELVLEEIKSVELARSVEVEGVAVELGLAPEASLRQLAEVAPAPWDALLGEHRAAFLTLTDEIVGLAKSNRELLARGYQAARELLASMDDGRVELYSSAGTTTESPAGALLVDEVL